MSTSDIELIAISVSCASWLQQRFDVVHEEDDLLQIQRNTPTIAKGEDQGAIKVMGHRPAGVGALKALAFVLMIGEAERFECGKQIAAF